jgi:hypothetical protein
MAPPAWLPCATIRVRSMLYFEIRSSSDLRMNSTSVGCHRAASAGCGAGKKEKDRHFSVLSGLSKS